MLTAHDLFHTDSRSVLAYLRNRAGAAPTTLAIRPPELSILLCGALMRAAGQDWYEQGDIWARVAHNRPLEEVENRQERATAIKPALQQLMTVDASAVSSLVDGGTLEPVAAWIGIFDHAGRALGKLAREGVLERGLRETLAHHILFHWNRLGLPYPTQAVLAATAKNIALGDETEPPVSRRLDSLGRGASGRGS